MPAPILTQPIASAPGVPASTVAVATSNQLQRVSQASRSGAGQTGGARIITANGSVASTDTFVGADTTSNMVTLTLTKVSEYRSAIFRTQRYKGANTFTVLPNPNTSDTIDGNASLVVTKMVELFPIDNATWHFVVVEN